MDKFEAKEHVVNEVSAEISLDTVVLIYSMCNNGALLFLMVYYIITLSDLECDYLNAQECTYRLNLFVLPKLAATLLLGFIFLISGHYWLCVACVPLIFFNVFEYRKVPAENFGVFDPTEILKPGQIQKHMTKSLISAAYYLIFFFVYLYCFLTHLLNITHVPKPTHDEDIGL